MVQPAPIYQRKAQNPDPVPVRSAGLLLLLGQALALAVAVGWIYWPALHGGRLWDDEVGITQNAVAQSPAGLWNIWFEPGTPRDYDPIKATVQWVQERLWADDTLGYHLTNVVLHVIGALLVWWLLDKLELKFSWLGALIFAVHPVQVESVAWIAELKNTLSLPLFLLAMIFYLDFEERGHWPDYLLSLGLFIVAMLAKPAMATFPVVILLYAWWKRGRIGWGDVKACAPFFLVSLALGLVAVYLGARFQLLHRVGVEPGVPGGFLSLLALAGSSLVFYLSKAILPIDLMPIYPQWRINPPPLLDFLPWVALAGLVVWFWSARQTWGRHAMLGFGFFLITLAPFVVVHVGGYAAFTWVMDHVLYLPIIGLIGLLVAGLETLEERFALPARIGGTGLMAIVLGWMTWQSHVYAANFTGAETFWSCALEKNPKAWPAQLNLGNLLLQEGRVDEAVDHLQAAVKLNPNFAQSRNDLGEALLRQGDVSDAIEQFQAAVRLSPAFAMAEANWGSALARSGRISDAIEHEQEALRIDPECAEAHYDWAVALVKSGQFEEAISQDEAAVQLKPDFAEAQVGWGFALLQSRRPWEAMAHDEEALRLQPNLAEAQNDWGDALMQAGQAEDAISHYQEALRLKPDQAEVHDNLGKALAANGQISEAEAHYREALRLDPNLAGAHDKLGNLLLRQGHVPEAITHYQAALKIKPDDAEAQDDWGNVLASQENTSDAIDRYQAAVQADPDFAPAQFDWANVLFHSGHVEEAIPHFLEAVRLDPSNADAHTNAGTALAADGQNNDALAQFETALQLKPGAGAQDNVGLQLLKMDRKPEALQHFQAALQLNPNDATAQSQIPPPEAPAKGVVGHR